MILDYSNKAMLSESFLSYFLEYSEKPDVKRYVKSNYERVLNAVIGCYENLLENNDYKDFDIKYQYSLINSCNSVYSKMYIYIRCNFLEWIMTDKDLEIYRQQKQDYQAYVTNNVIELVTYYQDYKTKLIKNRDSEIDNEFLDKLDVWCRKVPDFTEERFKREFTVYTLMKEIPEINKILRDKSTVDTLL